MRLVADVVQALGLVMLVVAAFLVWVPLGFTVLGFALLVFGLSVDPRVRRPRGDE